LAPDWVAECLAIIDTPIGEGMDERLGPARAVPTRAGPVPEMPLSGGPEQSVADPDGPAERAARLEADRALRDELAGQGFTGEAYAVLEDEFAGYGHQVMTAWLATGHIFARCHEAGLRLLSLPIHANDREDLAQETVAGALCAFKRQALEEGGWRPEGGASLKAYFTRTLLFQFANIWKKRLRAGGAPGSLPPESARELLPELPSPAPGPDDIAMQRDEIRRGLAAIERRARIAVVLSAEGYEQEEIAEVLGPDVSARAVEGLLRRHRSRVADLAKKGGEPQ
jgi:DNA-directed RNA polymerase specialized sigma24 family protein